MPSRIVPARSEPCVREDGGRSGGYEPHVERQEVRAPDSCGARLVGDDLGDDWAK
jgi:hypothetical protein